MIHTIWTIKYIIVLFTYKELYYKIKQEQALNRFFKFK